MNRYARQMIVPQIGPEGQTRLAQAHVVIIGLGGLGVPALQYLAGAGIGRLTLIDPDHVEASNLHRQPIYGADLGRPKALAALEFAQRLNGEIQLETHVTALTPSNVAALTQGADLVLDCADSFAASYLLSDHCHAARIPLISASALGLGGYVGGFCGGAPSLRAVFPDLPETLATCAEAGVVGPLVGMFGAWQAQMAIAHLVGLMPSPLGQLLRYDMQGFRIAGFRFDLAPEPEGAVARFIAPETLRESDLVIELRGPDEAPQPIVPWALRILPEALPQALPPVAQGQRVVLACRTGLRAMRAAEVLQSHVHGEIALTAAPRPKGVS